MPIEVNPVQFGDAKDFAYRKQRFADGILAENWQIWACARGWLILQICQSVKSAIAHQQSLRSGAFYRIFSQVPPLFQCSGRHVWLLLHGPRFWSRPDIGILS